SPEHPDLNGRAQQEQGGSEYQIAEQHTSAHRELRDGLPELGDLIAYVFQQLFGHRAPLDVNLRKSNTRYAAVILTSDPTNRRRPGAPGAENRDHSGNNWPPVCRARQRVRTQA